MDLDSIMANPFATETELLVLRLLCGAPAGLYGLQLVGASEGKLKRGMVYVTLGRLEENDFVESRTKSRSEHAGLPRPVYRLTGLGQRALAAADVMGFGAVRA
jgi:DNA-binding PadR family transcriptional regulator